MMNEGFGHQLYWRTLANNKMLLTMNKTANMFLCLQQSMKRPRGTASGNNQAPFAEALGGLHQLPANPPDAIHPGLRDRFAQALYHSESECSHSQDTQQVNARQGWLLLHCAVCCRCFAGICQTSLHTCRWAHTRVVHMCLQAEAATCPGAAAQQTTLLRPTTSWHTCLMQSC
jgi:hypothetical protein